MFTKEERLFIWKSETELCAMLKWAKEKGLTIEELSI